MNIYEVMLGQIPEALFFALFMILSKKIKSHRLSFISLMIVEYLLLMNILPFNLWSRILYFVVTYIILKMFYKERAQITDIFTMGIASLLMLAINIVLFFTIKNNIAYVIIDRLLLFLSLFLLRNKLPKIQLLYKKLWNRNDKIKKKMKTTTFRALNAVTFNFMFFIINVLLLYYLKVGR